MALILLIEPDLSNVTHRGREGLEQLPVATGSGIASRRARYKDHQPTHHNNFTAGDATLRWTIRVGIKAIDIVEDPVSMDGYTSWVSCLSLPTGGSAALNYFSKIPNERFKTLDGIVSWSGTGQ